MSPQEVIKEVHDVFITDLMKRFSRSQLVDMYNDLFPEVKGRIRLQGTKEDIAWKLNYAVADIRQYVTVN